jgi:hypothetical protein
MGLVQDCRNSKVSLRSFPNGLPWHLTAFKGVLVIGAWMVGNLNATATLICILKKIDVRALIKSMVARLFLWRSVKVMDISEAVGEWVNNGWTSLHCP